MRPSGKSLRNVWPSCDLKLVSPVLNYLPFLVMSVWELGWLSRCSDLATYWMSRTRLQSLVFCFPMWVQCKEQREVFSRGQGSSDVNTTTYPHLALRSRMLMLPVMPSWRTQRQIYIFFTLCPWYCLLLCPLLTCCTSSKKEIRALLTKLPFIA